jgi:transposase-like protein
MGGLIGYAEAPSWLRVAMGKLRSADELFAGHFDREVIILCVRWYLRFKLVRSCGPSKYLSNLIGQDHRSVKQRIAAMLGFKSFRHATIAIAGIQLMQRIRKRQFGLEHLDVQSQAAPEVWNAVLAA